MLPYREKLMKPIGFSAGYGKYAQNEAISTTWHEFWIIWKVSL